MKALVLSSLLFLTTSLLQGAQRVPWTASRIHGTPEKPLPYRIERIFPKLTFEQPIEAVTIPGTERLLVVQQYGRILSLLYEDGADKTEMFADFKKLIPGTRECYGITFHPRFRENRLAFVWLITNAKEPEEGTRIMRFRVTEGDSPRIEPDSGKLVFSWLAAGHNGGNMRFGPDGMLYISTGDAGDPDPPDKRVTGQDISDVLSSVLRIDVDHPDAGRAYGIPNDNPFLKTPKARGEVWAYGFRNPWRLSFDPKSGELYVGDVGWELWESIYRVTRGGNYGWSITEGSKQDIRPDRLRGPTPILPPLVVHGHDEAASITGGEFYHGKKLPGLQGAYIYGDWQMGTFWALRAKGDRVTERFELCHTPLMPAGFGIGPDAELILCDHGAGGLWRLIPNPDAGKSSQFPRQLSATGLFADVVKQQTNPGVLPYKINVSRWADHATAERWGAFPGTDSVKVASKELGVIPAGRWTFPADTVMAKTYSLELVRGKPTTRKRIETQILHYDGLEWAAYSYRWNEAQTDAELVPARGDEAIFEVKDPGAAGGLVHQKWRFFSRSECLRCHSFRNNYAPGFSALQLDCENPEGGSQIDALQAMGLAPQKPKRKEARLVNPLGTEGTAESRARSYLHANCGVCHRPHGGGAVRAHMDFETPLREGRILDEKPVLGNLGLPEGRIVAPGDPFRSVMLYRMATSGRGHMPYLGGKLVDDRGLLVVRDWIESLRANETELSPEVRKQRQIEGGFLAQIKAGQTESLETLLRSASGALSVALAIVDGSLKEPVRAAAIAKGNAIPDPLRRDLFERFLPEEQRRVVLGNDLQPAKLLAMRGDAERGHVLFSSICGACHRARVEGTDFGPELTHIATKWKRPELLEQILFPSKVIDPQWQLTTLTLKSGETKSGFVSARDGSGLTLKMAGGEVTKISNEQILKTSTERISLMPEGLLQGLTANEAG
ncbi:MAG TPA: PQQ-dependent sugar dehydrogenase, partial [Candidatus Saccharimonadales bacterium]|nr:PQQ-dependent sugar dehydrogenase [Candidatus Saccharimonadales bacterium]